ncbi:elongation factor 1-gamma-like [Ctenocephalides felis]|uniref:elongation factor 1-gamma-like n=1 Tax=Ctenocephalides felis TaxID=7515 RepID=UPI000E6E10EB|nr:elongation factor 1-gamma-like [Ctenocephalides felis]
MASGTLYTYPENFRAYKSLIAAKFSGANVKVAADFAFGETNKSESFLKKFPAGKVPAFESNDGKYLSGSDAIAYYVSNAQLRGASELEKAQILQWVDFGNGEIVPPSCAWVFPILGIMQFNKQTTDRAKEDVKSALSVLNTHLVNNTYLVGERITLADISVFCSLLHLYQHVLEPSFRAPFGSVTRWFTTILNQPQVKSVVGNFTLCTKMGEFDAKKFAEVQAKSGAVQPKKDKKEKKPQTPKAELKAEEPAEEMDAAEAALAGEPKSKDPFDSLPKGTFNMDDFKRFYSNEDESKSVPYFWEKFDPENYSIWFGEYKYNDELTKVFMSCNLITGMFQRLDKMRKQAFSSVCLFGEDNNSSISGVWVWRGQELAFNLSPDWQIDYETYNWVKLDPKSEETKKLVKQYFSWEGADKNGRKFNQGKVFK